MRRRVLEGELGRELAVDSTGEVNSELYSVDRTSGNRWARHVPFWFDFVGEGYGAAFNSPFRGGVDDPLLGF